MKALETLLIAVCLSICLAGCTGRSPEGQISSGESPPAQAAEPSEMTEPEPATGSAPADEMAAPFDTSTSIQDVINDSVFGGYGRLLFPVDDWYMSGSSLGDLQLTWYNNIDPEETVEIVNTLWQRANAGETVFYDIYTEEEKAANPEKADTGLFYFKGEPHSGGGMAEAGRCLLGSTDVKPSIKRKEASL